MALCQMRSVLYDGLQAFKRRHPNLLEDTCWLGLFAGAGSGGLEALSRGAAHCQSIQLDITSTARGTTTVYSCHQQ